MLTTNPTGPFLGLQAEEPAMIIGPAPNEVGSLHEELAALALYFADRDRYRDREGAKRRARRKVMRHARKEVQS